jgi:aryl-alcohol dehydrogenase-like predicted oxidoreductase
MKFVERGGVRLSAIGLGTWQFGSREWGYGEEYADEESLRIVGRALDLGINLIDTAEIYGFGASERIVGRAIAGRRDEAFVATKIFPLLPVGPVVGDRARRSARRLGVDAIDLYQVHQPNPVVPDSLIMPPMRRLVDEGLVRHVGVSNYSLRAGG